MLTTHTPPCGISGRIMVAQSSGKPVHLQGADDIAALLCAVYCCIHLRIIMRVVLLYMPAQFAGPSRADVLHSHCAHRIPGCIHLRAVIRIPHCIYLRTFMRIALLYMPAQCTGPSRLMLCTVAVHTASSCYRHLRSVMRIVHCI